VDSVAAFCVCESVCVCVCERERESFIDFEKAFDSIWHEGLFLKLLENGIGGKTFDLINNMYKTTHVL